MRSLTSPPSSPRAGRLLGAVVTVAALGTAASAAVLGITSAYGGHAAHDSASITVQAPAAAPPAATGGHDMSGVAPGGASAAGADAADAGDMAGMGAGDLELYAVQTGTLGIVVTDGGGRLLYGSARDANNPPTSRCTDACAQEWQPVIVPKGQQPELLGVDARTVGRIGRQDGSSQLTLGGWPVYVNRDDDGGLNAAAPDAHGSWFVMTPQGGKVSV